MKRAIRELVAISAFALTLAGVRFAIGAAPDTDRGALLGWYGLFIVAFCLGFGIIRVSLFHPTANTKLGQWLKSTPWRWPQRLPFGTPFPTVADLIVVAIAGVSLPGDLGLGVLIAAAAYSLGYQYVVVSEAVSLDERIGVGGGLAIAGVAMIASTGVVQPSLYPVLVVLIGGVLVAMASLRRLLRAFDRTDVEAIAARRQPKGKQESNAKAQAPESGDAVRSLEDKLRESSTPQRYAAWEVSLAVLWLASCAEITRLRWASWANAADAQAALEPGGLAGGFRLFVYLASSEETFVGEPRFMDAAEASCVVGLAVLSLVCAQALFARVFSYWSPISLFGRVATGRLIIPGHDYVYVGPFAAIATYLTISALLWSTGVFGILAGGVSLAVSLWVLRWLTPTIDEWRLTGHHRNVGGQVLPDGPAVAPVGPFG